MKLFTSSSATTPVRSRTTFPRLVRAPLVPALLISLFAVACASPGPSLNSDGSVTTYQVTGKILQLTETRIVIEKGTSQWELVRTPSLHVTGELKVGAVVTITYLLVGVKSEPRLQ